MLADIEQRLSAYRAGREDARIRLRDNLHLATNAQALYLACDGARKRLCTQAFFTKFTLTEDLVVSSQFTGVLRDHPQSGDRLHAEFWQRTRQSHPDITLNRNEETLGSTSTLPTDHGGRVGTSTKWWM